MVDCLSILLHKLTENCMHAGEAETYTGEAVNPANLSWCEGLLGVGKSYKPGHNAVEDTIDGSDAAVAT